MEHITSPTNEKVKQVVRLREKGSARREAGLFPAEGVRLVSEVPVDRMAALFVTEEWEETYWLYLRSEGVKGYSDEDIFQEEKRQWKICERMKLAEKGKVLFVVSKEVFAKMADTQTPQGVLALVRSREDSLEEVAERASRLLFLENLQDPGNLGTMLRVAEAAGAALVLTRGCADPQQPKAVRASMGAVFRVPAVTVEIPSTAISQLKEAGFRVFAGHLRGEDMYETDLSGRAVFLIGNEGSGLSDTLTGQADELVKIPMEGKVESLNAAMSAGLLLYESRRQSLGS